MAKNAKTSKSASTPKPKVTRKGSTPTQAKPVSATPAVAASVATVEAAVVELPAKSERRDRSTIITLIAKLSDADADIARDAAVTLGNLPPDIEATDALIAVVRNENHFYHSVVRTAAATSLGQIGDRRAVDALIHATRDEMAEASEEAIKALGLLKDPRALPALESIVANADGFYLNHVRLTAEQAIRQIAAGN